MHRIELSPDLITYTKPFARITVPKAHGLPYSRVFDLETEGQANELLCALAALRLKGPEPAMDLEEVILQALRDWEGGSLPLMLGSPEGQLDDIVDEILQAIARAGHGHPGIRITWEAIRDSVGLVLLETLPAGTKREEVAADRIMAHLGELPCPGLTSAEIGAMRTLVDHVAASSPRLADRSGAKVELLGAIRTAEDALNRLKDGRSGAYAAASTASAPRWVRRNFDVLALGARFRYHQDDVVTWVKIGFNRVAEWDPAKIDANWVEQMVCSARERGQARLDVWIQQVEPDLLETDSAPDWVADVTEAIGSIGAADDNGPQQNVEASVEDVDKGGADALTSRLSKLEKLCSAIPGRLRGISAELFRMAEVVDQLDSRVSDVEASLQKQIHDLDARFARLWDSVDQWFAGAALGRRTSS